MIPLSLQLHKFSVPVPDFTAMANAQEVVKQHADFITLSNEEDGVAAVGKLPERLKVMTTRLNEDYTCLKVVYDEWIGYYSWMQKLKTQISAITYPEMQVSLF